MYKIINATNGWLDGAKHDFSSGIFFFITFLVHCKHFLKLMFQKSNLCTKLTIGNKRKYSCVKQCFCETLRTHFSYQRKRTQQSVAHFAHFC